MTNISISKFSADIKQDKNLNNKLRSAKTIQGWIEVAESYGYKFSTEDFVTELDRVCDDTLAALINPGVTPRRHLQPH